MVADSVVVTCETKKCAKKTKLPITHCISKKQERPESEGAYLATWLYSKPSPLSYKGSRLQFFEGKVQNCTMEQSGRGHVSYIPSMGAFEASAVSCLRTAFTRALEELAQSPSVASYRCWLAVVAVS